MPLSRLIDSITNALRQLFGGTTQTGTTPTSAPALLACPNEKEMRATQSIGPEGGTLKLAEHVLAIPRGAVSEKVSFSATLLADKVMKVQLQANGKDSFRFAQPVSLTLSYGRCEAPRDAQSLRVYKLDPATDRVIQDLGGKVDPENRSVTASLDSFSIYTLGSPTDKPAPDLP
jgi:hypothetical protein